MLTSPGSYSQFKSIDSGISNNTLEGLLPIPKGDSAGGFAYRKEVIARNLPEVTQTIKDDWLVEILASSSPDARVLFRQRVEFGINVVSDGGIFIAYPIGDDQLKVTTSIIEGADIDPTTAKEHLDLGYLSEFGITGDFTANMGVGGGEAKGFYQSLPYRCPIPGGSIWRIVRDGWRPAGLSKIATYKFAFKLELTEVASLFDDAGALRVAAPNSTGVDLKHRYADGIFIRRQWLEGVREPSIWKDPTNRLWLAATEGGALKLWVSYDDGRKMNRVQVQDPKDSRKQMDVTIFDSTYQYPRAIRLQSGDIAALAIKGGTVYFKRAPVGSAFTVPAIPVAKAQKNEPYSLSEDTRNGTLWATNGHGHLLSSLSGGRSWQVVMQGS